MFLSCTSSAIVIANYKLYNFKGRVCNIIAIVLFPLLHYATTYRHIAVCFSMCITNNRRFPVQRISSANNIRFGRTEELKMKKLIMVDGIFSLSRANNASHHLNSQMAIEMSFPRKETGNGISVQCLSFWADPLAILTSKKYYIILPSSSSTHPLHVIVRLQVTVERIKLLIVKRNYVQSLWRWARPPVHLLVIIVRTWSARVH